MQPVRTKKKLSRADRKQIEAAIARANRTDKKEKSAQDSIPYERMWPDGICRVSDGHYTKTIQFQDINYQLSQNEDKTAIFEGWCDFLNYFDSSIKFELSFLNLAASKETFARAISIPLQGDDFDSIRVEYMTMLQNQLAKGNNGLTALYEKMAAEQDKYRDWLKSQPPAEVLNHAYEYTVREDIVMAMEQLELTDAQAQALLDSPTPLADVYSHFEKLETGYMDVIRDSIENRADDACKAQAELRKAAIYPHSAVYAKEHGELEQYRASNNANLQCKEAIEAAVREHFDGMYLSHDAAKGVIETSDTVRCGYALNSHPAVLNGFIDLVREEHLRRQPLTAEDIQTEAERILRELRAPDVPNSPHGTHYMARISPEFLNRAGSKDHDRLMNLLPFRSLAFTGMKGLPGTYATILANEDRSKELRQPRSSVREHLKQEPKQAAPKAPAHKKREPER